MKRKTKFFDDYIGKFESVYKKNYEFLADLNLDFIKTVLEILGYDVPIKKTSEMNLTKSKNEATNMNTQHTTNNSWIWDSSKDYPSLI
jgi:hypothetical protein